MRVLKETLQAEADGLRKLAEPIWEVIEGHERDRRAFESSLVNFEQQRLCITVMGEFNTGKSTLLNTFIGKELLATDQLECTAVPTWVRWADDEDFDENRQAVVIYTDGESDSMPLSEISVHTTLYQDSWKAIERVEIMLPQPTGGEERPIGLVLVDTPGLNGNPELEARSIHQLGMSHVTIVVVPVDGIERKSDTELIERALSIADRVMVVINKCDQQTKMGYGFVKFKERLRKLVPSLRYKDIYTLSAKRQFDGAAYQDGEDELKEEFYLFSADLKNALENPTSALRSRPVVLLREICKKEITRIKKREAECDADISKEVEVVKAHLEDMTTNLENSQNEILHLARKTMMGELASLERFLTKMRTDLTRKRIKFVDRIEDAMLLDDDLEAAQKSALKWLNKSMQKPIFYRVDRLLRASARRLIFDFEDRGVNKVDALDLPRVPSFQLDTATLEQQADIASKALSRRESEIEILKKEVEECKQAVKERKTKVNSLGKQCAQLRDMEVKRKEAEANKKRLGLKPNPKVVYYTTYVTREVERGGLIGSFLNLLHTKTEKVAVKRQRKDYSRVEKWERDFNALNKKIADLDKKMMPLKNMQEEMRNTKDELPKLQRAVDKAQRSLRGVEARLAYERDTYRRSSLKTRREQLRKCTGRELEKIFNFLPHALEREAEEMLKRISQGFSSRFKEAADRQRKLLADEMERRKRLAHVGDTGRAKRKASRKTLEKALGTFLNEDREEQNSARKYECQ